MLRGDWEPLLQATQRPLPDRRRCRLLPVPALTPHGFRTWHNLLSLVPLCIVGPQAPGAAQPRSTAHSRGCPALPAAAPVDVQQGPVPTGGTAVVQRPLRAARHGRADVTARAQLPAWSLRAGQGGGR